MTSSFDTILNELRRNLPQNQERRDAGRLFHGRGNCFPGFEHLNIDFYPPVLVFQLFKEEPHLEDLIAQVAPEVPGQLCILIQERYLPKCPWHLFSGQLPVHSLAWENGLAYQLQFMKNQNVGFFLDMRSGRELVGQLAEGKRVLNLFAYTCSLSVAAVAAKAKTVWNLDMSKSALRVGRENHIRNGLDVRHVRFLPYDILKSFGKIGKNGPYDLVIIDPPTHQRGGFSAEKDYAKIVRRLPECLAPGALVLACLNAPKLSATFLEDLFPQDQFTLRQRLGRPLSFPERNGDESLKLLLYEFKGGP